MSGAGDPQPGSEGRPDGRIAILVQDTRSGGVQRMMALLAEGLAGRGMPIDLVVLEEDADPASAPPCVRLVGLEREPAWRARLRVASIDPGHMRSNWRPLIAKRPARASLSAIRGLARYFGAQRPAVALAPTPNIIFAASLAKRMARSDVPIIASFRSHLSSEAASVKHPNTGPYFRALRRALTNIDQVHAVSQSVADDVARVLHLPREDITVCHSPTLRRNVDEMACEPIDHPWLAAARDRSVLIAVGRIAPQKDYDTLIAGFAAARQHRPMRLIIVGEVTEGLARTDKKQRRLARKLAKSGVTEDVAVVGRQANPFAWMAKADLFVLTSRFEGLPNVVIEALACGCRIVATDAPGGTAEVLDGGAYGRLVPVGDPEALGTAILETLDQPPDPGRQRARAVVYDADRSLDAYARLLERAAGSRHQNAGEAVSSSSSRPEAVGLSASPSALGGGTTTRPSSSI